MSNCVTPSLTTSLKILCYLKKYIGNDYSGEVSQDLQLLYKGVLRSWKRDQVTLQSFLYTKEHRIETNILLPQIQKNRLRCFLEKCYERILVRWNLGYVNNPWTKLNNCSTSMQVFNRILSNSIHTLVSI